MTLENVSEELTKIFIEDDNGCEIPFFILDKATILDNDYYLAISDEDVEKADEMLILLDISDAEDEEMVFEVVEDEDILENVMAVFEEQLEDINLIF